MNSAIKLGISTVIIIAVILSSTSNINWASLVGISNNSNKQSNQDKDNDDISLNVAYFPNLNHASAIIGFENGNFKKIINSANNPKNISINERVFNSAPAVIEAIYAGQIDVAYINPNSIIDGYILSGSNGFKIISGASSGGASFVVRNDSGIESLSDLGGKKFASPQLGNTQDVALRKYLQDNGFDTLQKGGNVTVINLKPADLISQFQNKEIDGAWVPEPIVTILHQLYQGKILVDERDLWPDGKFVTSDIIVRTDYLEQNPDVIKKLLEAHVDETKWLIEKLADANNTQNVEEVVTGFNKGLSKITGKMYPQNQLKEALSRIDFTVDPLPDTLLSISNSSNNLGFIKTGSNWNDGIAKIYDLTILNQVLSEKGENQINT
ncbi:MAG TPA: ABC transporter substrate-binding protein [Candidatus Nitrosocosmicus sp.]|nr:ABC transporter substrate-binding protein [Candidatus Nitrosocosmicus sp.]